MSAEVEKTVYLCETCGQTHDEVDDLGDDRTCPTCEGLWVDAVTVDVEYDPPLVTGRTVSAFLLGVVLMLVVASVALV